jgi:homoserine dehydrogenase
LKPVSVGLLGLGTVGGGTLNVLVRNAAEIARRAGREIVVTHAAARDYDPERWTVSMRSRSVMTPLPSSTTPRST